MRTQEIVLAMLFLVFASVGSSAGTIGLGGAPGTSDDSGYELPPITGPLPWMPVLPETPSAPTQTSSPSLTTSSDPPCIGGAPSCYSDTISSNDPPNPKRVDLPASVPEPSTWAMMILGFCGLALIACRRKRTIAKLNAPAL
jgi:hypothetical protein